jgi:ABC-type uncharacterized transport system substrate-binding protein
MRRRQVIVAVVCALAGRPFNLFAQQLSKTWRVGFIAHRYEKFYDPLFSGLKELGYVEGQNLIVERRYAEGNAERFKEFAAEMVRLNVDAVIVVTTPAAVAVKNETKTIPIIHPAAIDPVGTGLIASLAHPGGNVTGFAVLNAETSAKRVELLQEVIPGLTNGAVLWNSANPANSLAWQETESAGRKLGVKLRSQEVRSPKDFEGAFAEMSATPRRLACSARCADTGVSKGNYRLRIAQQAARHVCWKGVGRGRWTVVLQRPFCREVSTRCGYR